MNILAMCKEMREITGLKNFGEGSLCTRKYKKILFRPTLRARKKLYWYLRIGNDSWGLVTKEQMLKVLRKERDES